MYLADADAVMPPGGAATMTVTGSVTVKGTNSKCAVLRIFCLSPDAEGTIPCRKALWQQFISQPVPAIWMGIWQSMPIWLIDMPQSGAQGAIAGAPMAHVTPARAG